MAPLVSKERPKITKMSPETSDSSDEDEELEVCAPLSSTPLPNKDSSGPRLSSSGGSNKDPLVLHEDSSSEEEGTLFERLQRRDKQTESPPPTKQPGCFSGSDSSQEDFSSSHSFLNPKKAPAAEPTTKDFPAPNSQVVELLSSSDDESVPPPVNTTKKPSPKPVSTLKRLDLTETTKQPSSTLLSSTLYDDSSSDDSILGPLKSSVRRSRNLKPYTSDILQDKRKEKDQQKRIREFEKQRLQDQKKLAREQVKQAKEQEKAAKELAKLERQRKREEKKAADLERKESNKRRRDTAAQTKGKHAVEEIAVLMDPDLANHEVLPLYDSLGEKGYHVCSHPTLLGYKAIQFVRRDYLRGGAVEAVKRMHAGETAEYERFDDLVVVFDLAHDFLDLLSRSEDQEEDDYPKLERWLERLIAGWRTAWKVSDSSIQPRVLLMLFNVQGALDKLWISYRKHVGSRAPPTAEELHDAITWLLVQFQCECIDCKDIEDLNNHVRKMTRMLSEKRYQKQVSEFECVKKIKAFCDDLDPDSERATDCWQRQLQQIPTVSLRVASSLVQYYPTARTLWEAYQNDALTVDQKRMLVSSCCGTGRCQAKISNYIYQVMTSDNPNDLLR